MKFTEETIRERIVGAMPRGGSAPGRTADGLAAGDGDVNVSDLRSIRDNDAFLREAYLRIFGREVDPSGFVHYTEMLRSGTSRDTILNYLANSEEARRTGRQFTGISTIRNAAGAAYHHGRGIVRIQARKLVVRATGFLKNVLQINRLERLDHKLDYVSLEVDRSLSTLSSKLDEYVADLNRRQSELAAAIANVNRSSRAALLRVNDDMLITEVDGFILGIPSSEWRLAAYHAFRGVLEPGTTRLFQQIVKPGMTVADVGANIGIYTLYAARLVGPAGRVYSFEPAPRTFELLKDNIQVNGFLEAGIIDARCQAVLDRSGECELTVYSDNSGHNTLFAGQQAGETVRAETVSLDQALDGVARLDVVKVDAEGAEPFVLRGMSRLLARNPGLQILMEFAPVHLRRAGVDPASFLDEITRTGFEIFRIDDMDGALHKEPSADLLGAHSANLYLKRDASRYGVAG